MLTSPRIEEIQMGTAPEDVLREYWELCKWIDEAIVQDERQKEDGS